MNIKTLKKIMKGRQKFEKMEIKKSGYNKYHNFHYYELKDILPIHHKLMEELKLGDIPSYEDNMSTLYIYDLEQDDNQQPIKFTRPITTPTNTNLTQANQEHGKTQTYSRRYLLLQLWDIEEYDGIDCTDQTTKKQTKKTKKQVEPFIKVVKTKEQLEEAYNEIKEYCHNHGKCVEDRIWAYYNAKRINDNQRDILLHWNKIDNRTGGDTM